VENGMKRLALICFAGAALLAAAPSTAQLTSYAFMRSGDPVQDKNFYLLTVLDAEPSARAAVAADPVLKSYRDRSVAALRKALANCRDPGCVAAGLTVSEPDIAEIGNRLAALADRPLKALIRDHLRPSGRFQKHALLEDAAFIRAAWAETAHGMNRLYRVYGLGEAPRYPDIDAISYNPEDQRFYQLISTALETADDGISPDTLFFEPWAQIGQDLLLINQRDEAGRYEPLSSGENAAALKRAATIAWQDFPYSAILIPGAGLRDEERGLSAIAAMRLRLAVRRYEQRLAPLIIVSGGNVHPNKTPYNEAIEMKRALIDRYGIPEDAILVDPHARHTTTNLRNAVRLLFRAGAPLDREVLVSTSKSQSDYIAGQVFYARNQDELGYQPMKLSRRISTYDLAMRPEIISLHADPVDALDP
jgi:hypothetical protein